MTAVKWIAVGFVACFVVALFVGKYIAVGQGPELEDESEREAA